MGLWVYGVQSTLLGIPHSHQVESSMGLRSMFSAALAFSCYVGAEARPGCRVARVCYPCCCSPHVKSASLTYYCPQLIRQGVITVGDLINNSTHISQIAPTWASIYQQGVFHYGSSNPGQAPTEPPPPSRSGGGCLVTMDHKIHGLVSLLLYLPRTKATAWGMEGLSLLQCSCTT